MDRPIVSIIIPTYNYGRFLQDALASLRKQSMQQWECIVVDDCSTDQTEDVVKSFAAEDSRFIYHRLERNSGVSAARNAGIAIAQGTFIQLLDADDAIAPDKLNIQVDYLQLHPQVDLVYSDFFHFTDTIDFNSAGEYTPDEKLNGSSDVVLKRLLRGNVFRMNTLLIRRKVFDQGGFIPEFRAVEDWEFWMRCAVFGFQFAYLDDSKAISAVRVNPNGLSKDLRGMRRFYLPVLQHIWIQNGVSLQVRNALWLRYLLTFFDHLFFRKGDIRFIPERKTGFVLRLFLLGIFTWPFFFLYKLMRILR